MVAREIGEAAGGDAHAIEAILVEAVRGRLEGEMRDAVARDLVELAMQRDRIGRGQRAVDGALRRDEADGADARGVMAKALPDLPREGSHGRLAAGAGDGGDGLRLKRKESCRGQRQRAARIGRHHEGNVGAVRPMLACNRDRARRDGRFDEARAVGLAAGKRKEQIARLHDAAVDGKPPHLDRLGVRIDRGISAEEIAKSHAVPFRPAAGPRRLTPAIAVDY